jgi:hypothetical protein
MMSEKRKSRVFRIEISDEEHKAEAARVERFNGWLAECEELQNAVVEGLLANLPSLVGK